MNILNRTVKLLSKRNILIRLTGKGRTERAADLFKFAHNHIWIIKKVTVYKLPRFVFGNLHPFGHYIRHSFTLLQEQNIRRNLCSGVFLKGVIRQANSAD